MPVFVANGDSDPMILPHYVLSAREPYPARPGEIYPDSAHGFLFQHPVEFVADVEAFLTADSLAGPVRARVSLSEPGEPWMCPITSPMGLVARVAAVAEAAPA